MGDIVFIELVNMLHRNSLKVYILQVTIRKYEHTLSAQLCILKLKTNIV